MAAKSVAKQDDTREAILFVSAHILVGVGVGLLLAAKALMTNLESKKEVR